MSVQLDTYVEPDPSPDPGNPDPPNPDPDIPDPDNPNPDNPNPATPVKAPTIQVLLEREILVMFLAIIMVSMETRTVA